MANFLVPGKAENGHFAKIRWIFTRLLSCFGKSP
jgi:hypothetical protein